MPREVPEEKLLRMTEFERPLWAAGERVAGIDEVGRGPLCGPVMAACVIVPQGALIPGVDDSKKLSPARREALHAELMASASYVRVASVPREVIDKINILEATKRAMCQAAEGAAGAFFLIDAVTGLALPGASRSIVGGDARSYMIAAASIIAKVERDRYMADLHERYPDYGFLRNKGYGTPEHIAALRRRGPCPEHRRSFIGKILVDTAWGGDADE